MNWQTAEQTQDLGGDIVIGELGWPSDLPPERLLFNVGALRSAVIRWGNFESMTLDAADDAEVDGMITRTIKKPGTSRTDPNSDGFKAHRNKSFGDLEVVFGGNQQRGSDIEHAAANLDQQLSRAVMKAVWRHQTVENVSAIGGGDVIPRAIVDAALASFPARSMLEHDYIEALVFMGVRAVVIWPAFKVFDRLTHGTAFGDNKQDPLLWSIQPTRALISSLVLGSNNLVKVIDS